MKNKGIMKLTWRCFKIEKSAFKSFKSKVEALFKMFSWCCSVRILSSKVLRHSW